MMKTSFALAIFAFLFCAFTFTTQAQTSDVIVTNRTIWEYLTSNETVADYSNLISLILNASTPSFDLVAYLNDSNRDITLFAPTNNWTLPPGNLLDIALYHVYPTGRYDYRDLPYIDHLTSALFYENIYQPAILTHYDLTNITIGNSFIRGLQVNASNGLIHNIDKLLVIPESLVPFLSRNQSDFTTLLALLSFTPNVLDTWNSSSTVLAPTNEAISDLGSNIVYYLTQTTNESARDREAILKAHIIDRRVYYRSEFINGSTYTTLNGDVTFIHSESDNRWSVYSHGDDNEADFITFNILTANAVIHAIDSVILPIEFIWRSAFIEGFTYSYEAIRSALPSLLQEVYVTVLLPENSAYLNDSSFNLTNIPYHVLSGIQDLENGETVFFETRYKSPYAIRPQVIRVNRFNDTYIINGQAHISRVFTIGNVRFYGISSVLSLPEPPSAILTRYPTLHELLVVAGLEEAINDENTTIFAPQGFSPFGPSVHPEWLRYLTNTTDGIAKLKVILLTHVVPSVIYSDNIPFNLTTVTSKSGVELQIYKTEHVVYVNDIVVSSFDQLSTAGVIHTLADVIVPSTVTISLPQILSIQPEVSDFYKIVENANQEETLVGKTTFIPTNQAVQNEKNLPTSGQFLNDLVNNHILTAEVGPLKPGQTFPTETHNTTIHISGEPGHLVVTLQYLGENVTSANIVPPSFSALPSSQGNAYLIDKVLYSPRESKPTGGLSKAAIIGIAVGAGVVALIILAVIIYMCCCKRSSYQSVS